MESETGRSAGKQVAVDVVVTEAVEVPPNITTWLGERFEAVARQAGAVQGTICISIIDDQAMARLHEQYCNMSGTTDVLTFDLREQPDAPVEADLVLCFDEAKRQADSRGHDVQVELLLYAVHGLLHLLGEDDHDPEAAASMHAREDELLKQAGVGAVYARPVRHGEPLR